MKSGVLVWPEDLCGKEKLLKFKQFFSQLLRFHIVIPHELFSKSRPDSLFIGSTTVVQGKLYNRLIMTKHLIVPGLLKYSTKEGSYEGNFINLSALSHIFSTDDEKL
jgi:hypothetical protein